MQDIRIASVQFEHRDGDKAYNLGRIHELTRQAVDDGAEVASFHECCISAYSFVQPLPKQELLDLAEPVPDGPSVQRLIAISAECGVPVLAGLFEREDDRVYNTYVCVTANGVVAKHRKLHAFVSQHLSSGDDFTVFDLNGTRCGILICYDNNIAENVRATALLGAEVVFMPHVTGCLPSVMPGRGTVSTQLWDNRESDPVRLRQEFHGPKGRGWLMRFLPTRAWENGIYAIFSNPIGMDFGEVRNGNAMVIDPFGEVVTECHKLGDDICIAHCTDKTLQQASGRRYLKARRPELYGVLTEPTGEPSITAPGWKRSWEE
jgi:predicted amidohydrolase